MNPDPACAPHPPPANNNRGDAVRTLLNLLTAVLAGFILAQIHSYKEALQEHKTGGPHDEVAELIAVINTNLTDMNGDIHDIKTDIKALETRGSGTLR